MHKQGAADYISTAIVLFISVVLGALVFSTAFWIFDGPVAEKTQSAFSEQTDATEQFTEAEFGK